MFGISTAWKSSLCENGMEILEKIITRYPDHTFVIDMDDINELGLVYEEPTEELSGVLDDLDELLMSFDNTFIELNQKKLSRWMSARKIN